MSAWAADGLLAIFFFVVGLELKREFVAGDLRDPARAALPIAAAVGGMVVPAAVYIAINLAAGHPDYLDGWAVPIATDIAFALAVLAVLSTHLPSALRTFLLTLAVVDDLLAITVIAVFYTDHLSLGPLALALIPIGLFGLAAQRGVHHWWLLVPLAVVAWALVHASGVHATVAGVLLGFTVPVLGSATAGPTAEHFEHRHAAGVGGLRGPGVRLLRRRCHGGRLVRFGRIAAAPDHRRRRSPAWWSANPLACSRPRSCWPSSPMPASTTTWRWRDVLGVCAAGRDRVHSFVIDRRVGVRVTAPPRATTSRSVCSSGPLSLVCWPRWFC